MTSSLTTAAIRKASCAAAGMGRVGAIAAAVAIASAIRSARKVQPPKGLPSNRAEL